jgi:uncharacterized protein YoxC
MSGVNITPTTGTFKAEGAYLQGIGDLDSMTVESAMMFTLSDRHAIFTNDVKNRLKEMQDINNKLKTIGQDIATMTAMAKKVDGDKGTDHMSHAADGNQYAARRQKLLDLPGTPGTAEWNAAAKKEVASWGMSKSDTERWNTQIDMGGKMYAAGFNNGANQDPLGAAVGDLSKDGIDSWTAQLNQQKDALANDSSLKQIELQQAMTKLKGIEELLSGQVRAFGEKHATIISNMNR